MEQIQMLQIDIPRHVKKNGRRLKPFTGSLSEEWLDALRDLRRELPRTEKGRLQPLGSLLEHLTTDENKDTQAVRHRLRELYNLRRRSSQQHRS